MRPSHTGWRVGLCIAAVLGLMTVAVAPVSAQQSASPDTRAIDIAASIDFMNQYIFRGVPQNSSGMAMWPAVVLGINVHSGNGALRRVRVNAGFLNSLHTGDTGRSGPTDELWYESRLSGSLEIRFAGGLSLETSYTAFTSPNQMFTTVQEIGVKAAMQGGPVVGGIALEPYALAAFEVGAGMGEGQLDGGLHSGKYLELGMAPQIVAGQLTFTIPVNAGLSIGNYYELGPDDHGLGFASVGGFVTVPLRKTSGLGWHIRGGVQYHALGTTTKAFNRGDGSVVVGSIGLAVSR